MVSAAASVGTEQRSTGPLVVFASLWSVQSGHPPDLKEPEWKRVFSSKVFEKKNDITPSKVFERIYQGAVIEALKYYPQYEEGMSEDEILAVHGILSYSQTLEWKGAVEYCLIDRNGIEIEEK